MANKPEPFHLHPDFHFVWIGLPFTVLIGAGAWLGVPGMIIPMVLLIVAWLLFISYFWFMWPQWGKKRFIGQAAATLLCAGCAYLFYFVFAVGMNIRFLDGKAYYSQGEEVDLAVELVNRGKATSLRHWRAILIDAGGHESIGEPLTLYGSSVKIQDQEGHRTDYVLPDCDLIFETAKALQSGDSVYGIAAFLFRGYPGKALSPDTQVKIEATDMLGRTVSSQPFTMREIAGQAREVFPCREIDSKQNP
jgi:hypothetical protein